MLKHKVIDTIAAITALVLGVALSASAALAVRLPDPIGGGREAPPFAPPVPPVEQGPNWALIASFAVAGIALIALVALATSAITRRHGTSPA